MMKAGFKIVIGLLFLTTVFSTRAEFHYGSYRLPTDDFMDMAELEESNFTLIHAYHFEHKDFDEAWMSDAKRYLKAAAERGVKVFLGLPRSLVNEVKKGTGDALGTVKNIVGELKGEDGLFGWYLYDEPDVGKDSTLKKIYRTIKDADSIHPVIVVHFTPARFDEIGKFCDLPWVDTYPVPWSISRVYEAAVAAKKLAGKPVWSVIQAHGLEWKNARKKGQAVIQDKQHRPGPKEYRAMIHAALAADVPGIMVYFLPQYMHDMKKHTPLFWKAISEVGAELKMLAAPLEYGAKGQSCAIEVIEFTSRQRRLDKVYNGGEKGEPGSYYHEKKEILSWQRLHDGKFYCGIVNAGYTPQVKVRVSFERGVRRILQLPERRPVFEQGVVKQENSDVTVWKVSPDGREFELYFNEVDTVVWEVEFL